MTTPDDDLEDDFPSGGGAADMAAVVTCPHCGEPVEVALDPGSGTSQDYVEDCEVCCQPWLVRVRYRRNGSADLTVTALDA